MGENQNFLFTPRPPNETSEVIINAALDHEAARDNLKTNTFSPSPTLPIDEIAEYFAQDAYGKAQAEGALLTAHWQAELFPTHSPKGNAFDIEGYFRKADAAAGIKTKVNRTVLKKGKRQTLVIESNGSPVNITPITHRHVTNHNGLIVVAVPDEDRPNGWSIRAKRIDDRHGDKGGGEEIVYSEVPVDESTGTITFGRVDQVDAQGRPGVVAFRQAPRDSAAVLRSHLTTDPRQAAAVSSSHLTLTPRPEGLEIVDHSTHGTLVEQVEVADDRFNLIANTGAQATKLAFKSQH